MGISGRVTVLMMFAVQRYPLHRPTLHGERAADSHEIFHELSGLERAMGQKTVITHTNAETATKNMQSDADQDGTPGGLPKDRQCAKVDQNEENRSHRRKILAMRAINSAELEGCLSHQ